MITSAAIIALGIALAIAGIYIGNCSWCGLF
jgi:hypothetical protein